ncbi:MAG: MBL fold metallo-hydrolase [Proteobacteria bacterium]|nr:MBL fold metallo-hydrolase [Pseudomonadota bacterium]
MSNFTANDSKKCFFWACFLHFLGWDNDALKCIKQIPSGTSNSFTRVLNELKDYLELEPDSNNNQEKKNILERIQKELNQIIDTNGYGSERKFPRIPGHHIDRDIATANNDDLIDWYCAIAAYLLRGHCSFWTEKSYVGADYCSAKGAKNDLFQAHLLLLRVETHKNAAKIIIPEVTEFRQLVVEFAAQLNTWLHSLIEVFRGNIYYKIRDRSHGVRHYRKAIYLIQPRHEWNVFLNIITTNKSSATQEKIRDFTCKTIAKAKFQLSKIYLAKGLFVASLIWLLGALRDFILISNYLEIVDQKINSAQSQTNRSLAYDLCKNIANVIERLRKYQDYPFFPKKEINALFGGKNYGHCDCCKPITTENFTKDIVHKKVTGIVADIFSRIGFILYILKIAPARTQNLIQPDWNPDYSHIRDFFEPKHFLEYKTAYGSWGKLLLKRLEKSETAEDFPKLSEIAKQFSWSSDRLLAAHMLESFSELKSSADTYAWDESEEKVMLATKLGHAGMQYINNVVTIPQQIRQHLMRDGYKGRTRKLAEENKRKAINKLVVLRRWQSYNPKIPYPYGMKIRGGGLFLCWYEKGIVIDPGYDFVQNFYEQGFALEDIDAIVITHSHPDHDDELSTILTLMAEWNEFWEKNCGLPPKKMIDLFLNEGAFRKYDNWVHASKILVSNIYTLQTNVWDKGAKEPSEMKNRIQNQRVFLRNKISKNSDEDKEKSQGYNFDIEIVPAWHDELIDIRTAVGVIFHLYEPSDNPATIHLPVLTIGITGDTGYFESDPDSLAGYYENCDVVVAHLGDIKLREITDIIRQKKYGFALPLEAFVESYLGWKYDPSDNDVKPTQEKMRDFMMLVTSLDLVDTQWLEWNGPREKQLYVKMENGKDEKFSNLRDFMRWILSTSEYEKMLEKEIHLFEYLIAGDKKMPHKTNMKMEEWRDGITTFLDRNGPIGESREKPNLNYLHPKEMATVSHILQATIWLLCHSARQHYQPPFHLGIRGLFNIHQAMIKRSSSPDRILVIGELPEEMSSYRHLIARYLDDREENTLSKSSDTKRFSTRKVRCLTGDIGLHIGLLTKGIKFCDTSKASETLRTAVRCTLCNLNNELIRGEADVVNDDITIHHYHSPSQIQETVLVRMGNGMIYLCTTHHASTPLNQPEYFPNYLEIW